MTLGQKQRKFTRMIADLIVFAYYSGYELSFGDAYRDPRAAYGHPKSLHRSRLAVDLNLFKDGKYLRETEDHKPLGDFWETLDTANVWGGRWKSSPDGNHYQYGEIGSV